MTADVFDQCLGMDMSRKDEGRGDFSTHICDTPLKGAPFLPKGNGTSPILL